MFIKIGNAWFNSHHVVRVVTISKNKVRIVQVDGGTFDRNVSEEEIAVLKELLGVREL